MVDTIEKVLKPFFLIFCFHRFGICRNSSSYLRFCLNISSILIPLSVYACAVYYTIISLITKSLYKGFLRIFLEMINLSVTIISIITTICKREKFCMCVKNLGLVDDTLELLRIPKEYCKMRNSIKWILIIWFMIFCITWIFYSFWYMEKFQDARVVVISCITSYFFYLNLLMDIMIIFLLRYIGTKFNKINECIEQLSETEKCGLSGTWKKSPVNRYYVESYKNRKHILWISMHLHLELCRIARNINDFFGTQMTLRTIYNFVLLTAMIYLEYRILLCFTKVHKDSEENKVILLLTTTLISVNLMNVVTINYICESVSIKAKKTMDKIHKLTNLVYFDQLREDICQFIFQILLQPLKFDGMGLFCFGYKFIFKFIMGIVSIMLFMVGMDTSPLSRDLLSYKSNVTCFA